MSAVQSTADVLVEIATLKSFRGRLRSGFLADNDVCLDAQIEALERGYSESKSDDVFYGRHGEEDGSTVAMSALEAIHWREGRSASRPSQDWIPLLRAESPRAPLPVSTSRSKPKRKAGKRGAK